MSALRSFDLGPLGASGRQAVLDALRADRQSLLRFEFDRGTGVLTLEADTPQSADTLAAVVEGLIRTERRLPGKVLMRHHAKRTCAVPIDAELARHPDVQIVGEGLTGLRGGLLALFRFFERTFMQIAGEFGAEDQYYPVMLPSELLAEVGYFGHFPQHVTLCSHLPDRLPVLQEVAERAARTPASEMAQALAGRLEPPHHVLIPGVCLPCYRLQRGVMLAPDEVRTLTMQNHVFRYEADNFRPLARGWDFSVRDIVFFGSGPKLTGLREAVMRRAMRLCEELDLGATIALANDPFFLDASRDKAVYQRMGEVKYELLLDLPHRQEALAVSSFNLHRDFYTALYGTRHADGSIAESACMGFGLERWLYGFLSQKGLDPRRWPPRVTG
jgi:seryl-tRNA synthetase